MNDLELKNSVNVSSEYLSLIEKVAGLVHKISGNKLGDKQYFMIETRLKKRMLELALKTPQDYLSYIDQNLQKETGILVGLITTHHTFFFREFSHFELLKKMLPDLVEHASRRGEKTLKIWSAACSRGQEVYSLAMFLESYLPQIDPSFSYTILGTDIDADSVNIASNGVYHQNEIKEIPMNFLGNNWAKGTGDISMYAKIKNQIRNKCTFKVGNLLATQDTVGNTKFDVIFCRNVFIYFEQKQIENICKDLISHMHPNGLFFSGISESLSSFNIDFSSVGPSAYKIKSHLMKSNVVRPVVVDKMVATPTSIEARPPKVNLEIPDILKVLCIDDSPSILTLLKKILCKENGYEVVATAANGLEAIEMMKKHKVDIVTLDLHMPQMDGVTYLKQNYNKNHPPVVIISSVSRDDSDLAMKALQYGASDYVEKPSLQNLEEKGDEIRTKLRSVLTDRLLGIHISSLDKEMSKKIYIEDPSNKICIVMASISDFQKIKKFYYEFDGNRPPVVIFFEGQNEILESLIRDHGKDFKSKVELFDPNASDLKPGEVYFADLRNHYSTIQNKYSSNKTSIICFGVISKNCGELIMNWRNANLLLEDLGDKENRKNMLFEVATDVVPHTSFAYMSNNFLSKK